jgi:hypothetical protein
MAQKNYFVVVHKKTGEILLDSGRLPIFWMRRVAKEVADNHANYVVKPISIYEFETLLTQPVTHAH